MLWQESGGPDKGKDWTTWPMQIGKLKADTAILDVISGQSHTDLIAKKEIRDEIAAAYRQHKDDTDSKHPGCDHLSLRKGNYLAENHPQSS